MFLFFVFLFFFSASDHIRFHRSFISKEVEPYKAPFQKRLHSNQKSSNHIRFHRSFISKEVEPYKAPFQKRFKRASNHVRFHRVFFFFFFFFSLRPYKVSQKLHIQTGIEPYKAHISNAAPFHSKNAQTM